jgi:hypothetical protein
MHSTEASGSDGKSQDRFLTDGPMFVVVWNTTPKREKARKSLRDLALPPGV